MNQDRTKEGKSILKKLSPENQLYFMALVRVAGIAESNVKKSANDKQELPHIG